MKHTYSLAHLTALRCPTPELVRIAAAAGYDFISPRIVNLGVPGEGNYDLATQPDLLRETQRALEETGLGVHDIELLRILDGVDVARYEPAIEVGAKLGARHVLTSVWTAEEEFYTEQFAALCDLAARYGLGVQLEFVTWADLTDLDAARRLIEAVNRKNAGVMVDTLHAYRSRVAPEELDDCPPAWFDFCHICDGPEEIPTDKRELLAVGRDGRLYCGEGVIDIHAYTSRMRDDTVFSIELPHLARVAEYGYAEHVRRCIDSAKHYFARFGEE